MFVSTIPTTSTRSEIGRPRRSGVASTIWVGRNARDGKLRGCEIDLPVLSPMSPRGAKGTPGVQLPLEEPSGEGLGVGSSRHAGSVMQVAQAYAADAG